MRTRYEHVTFCFRMNVFELSMRCVGSIFQIEGTTIVMKHIFNFFFSGNFVYSRDRTCYLRNAKNMFTFCGK